MGEAANTKANSAKDVQGDLVVEEYKSCRELLSKNIDIIEKTEVYAAGAAAAASAFCLSSTVDAVAKSSCWLPLIVSVLGLVRFVGIDATIGKINNHLVSMENTYPAISWTKSYRQQNKIKVLKASRYIIWVALIGCSLAFGCYIKSKGALGEHPKLLSQIQIDSHQAAALR
jgi:hypothetical protein